MMPCQLNLLENAVGLKLNLGARDQKIPGYVSMDWDKHPGVDIVHDISDLSMLRDSSIESIVASHCLEHFHLTKTVEVLKEWRRVLKTDGTLYVAVPDFRRVIEIFNLHGLNEWLSLFVWGDQKDRGAFHHNGFTAGKLESYLRRAGFDDVSQLESFPFKHPHCCDLKYTGDDKLITLFMVAVK